MSGSDAARPAVFLDRDGTLIEEIDYLADPDAVRLIPGAAEAVRRLNELGRAVVIVTNQSGVARGILDLAVLDAIHAEVERRLAAEGAHLDAIESCPHHPDHDGVDSPRRKPEPGMLLDAAARLGLDLARSWTIGDALRDVQAGHRAGTRAILVETGKGAREARKVGPDTPDDARPEHVAPDLAAAVSWLLDSES